MKKKSKLLSIFLTTALILSIFPGFANAQVPNKSKLSNADKTALEEFTKQNGITIESPGANTQNYINFSSVDEFKKYATSIKNSMDKAASNSDVTKASSTNNAVTSSNSIQNGLVTTNALVTHSNTLMKSSVYTIPGFPPYPVYYYQNIVVNYTTDGSFIGPCPPITSTKVAYSYMSGVTIALSWTQRDSWTSVTRSGAQYTIKACAIGTFLLGASISGVPIGFSWSENWVNSFTVY